MVKKTGPGTPWYRPGPFKNLGKTKGSYRGAAGNQRACWGPPGKSYGRLETFKILGKTKGWGRTVNVVRKKQAVAGLATEPAMLKRRQSNIEGLYSRLSSKNG